MRAGRAIIMNMSYRRTRIGRCRKSPPIAGPSATFGVLPSPPLPPFAFCPKATMVDPPTDRFVGQRGPIRDAGVGTERQLDQQVAIRPNRRAKKNRATREGGP